MALRLFISDSLPDVSMQLDVITSVGKSDEWIETVASGDPQDTLASFYYSRNVLS